jgi:small-conductance mechanosensitive channel
MNRINSDSVARWLTAAQDWVTGNVLVPATLVQAIVAIALIALAFFLRRPLRQGIVWLMSLGPLNGRASRIRHTLSGLALPIAAIVLLWLAVGLANSLGLPHRVLSVIASLFNAWAVIRLFSGVAGDTALTRFVALVAWTIAALNILGLLEPTVAALDAASFSLGELRVSALTVLKGIGVLGVLLWLAIAASAALEKRIQGIPDLTPSVKVLLVNLSRIILIIVAVVAGISSVGIDLTAFAVFTGALGVGIGFGLQKVVGNFISGIIILLDKSIKPGDVIEIGNTYGRISSLGARYVSVVTPDAHEYLIPNEDFITTQVVNWSYSDNNVRQSADVGIHYKSDVRRAMAICLEAAADTPRILKNPPAKCFLKGFGDSSVDLLVSYWIDDPMNGTINVRSDLFLRIWDKFHAEGIEIPYPQRDLYIKEAPAQHASPAQP